MTMMKKINSLYKKYKEIINYLIFGVLTTVISLAVYYALVYTILNPLNAIMLQIANILSWTAGVIFAYITNRKYVFESNSQNILKEAVSFFSSRLATGILDMVLMWLFVYFNVVNDVIAKVIVNVIVVVLNYVLSKLVVFKGDK